MIQGNVTGMGSLGHPGIFIGQTTMAGLKNHVDASYVTSIAPTKPLDFGVLDLWALKQRTESPILSLAIDNAQVFYTDSDYYTFELPSTADTKCELISGGLDKAKFGADGEEFPMVVSRRDFSPGAIIKFDLLDPISFTVVERTIEKLGDHYKIWVRLNTNHKVKFVTPAHFQKGRYLIKLIDLRGREFSSHRSVWSIGDGVPASAKYLNFISNAKLQQEYRVTSGACEYLQMGTRFDARVTKMYEQMLLQFMTVKGVADSQVIDLRDADMKAKYMEQVRVTGGEKAFVNFLDTVAINMLQKQNNQHMLFGTGVDSYVDGYDTSRLAPGVWFQLDDAGYKRIYDLETFALDTITNAIKDFSEGKMEPMDDDGTKRVWTIRTGLGGQELIHNAFLAKGFNIPAVINNADHGFIKGDAKNLTYRQARFTEYEIPYVGILKVELDPSFDSPFGDRFVNPKMPSGRRLMSYTMLIADYNMNRDNIAIIRRQGTGGKLRMSVTNGWDATHPYFQGNTTIAGQNVQVVQGSDELSGYKVMFTGDADTAIVKDPTKLLKLVPINPFSGLSL